jgi:hypothetical protein
VRADFPYHNKLPHQALSREDFKDWCLRKETELCVVNIIPSWGVCCVTNTAGALQTYRACVSLDLFLISEKKASKNNYPRTAMVIRMLMNKCVREKENSDGNRQDLWAVGRNQRKAIQCRKISLNFPRFPLARVAKILFMRVESFCSDTRCKKNYNENHIRIFSLDFPGFGKCPAR